MCRAARVGKTPTPLPALAFFLLIFSKSMLVVISARLDDTVLSGAQPLAAHPGSVVVTVPAGRSGDAARSTDRDRACGLASTAQ